LLTFTIELQCEHSKNITAVVMGVFFVHTIPIFTRNLENL